MNPLDPVSAINATLIKVHHLDLNDFSAWDRECATLQKDGPKLFSESGDTSPEQLSALIARCIQKAGYPSGKLTLHSFRSGFVLNTIVGCIGDPSNLTAAWLHARYVLSSHPVSIF